MVDIFLFSGTFASDITGARRSYGIPRFMLPHVASSACLRQTDGRCVRPQAGAQPAPHRPASVGGPPEALAAATFCALLAP